LPGFFPVANDTHAEELIGGTVVVSVPLAPDSIKRRRVGKRPASIHGPSRSKVMPSSPRIKTFVFFKVARSTSVSIDSDIATFLLEGND
jgi:hypothetical protein